jgi:hypothetical protein
LQVSSPSISLSELQSIFEADNPDFERVLLGFRQKLHVHTLQEKLQKDNDDLARTIAALKRHVQSPKGFQDQAQKGDDAKDTFGSAAEEDQMQWQRRMVSFRRCWLALCTSNCRCCKRLKLLDRNVFSQNFARCP